MDKPLANKVALITGASRGIGRSISLRLAELGADIVLNYARNDEAAAKTEKDLRSNDIRVLPFRANVGDFKLTETMIDHAVSQLGGIDILIHNAAIGAFKPVHRLKPNQWDLSMDIIAKALLMMVQKVVPSMEERGQGNVIAISSPGSQRFIPNYGAIGISKAALESLVKYLAVELAPRNIRVNGVSGGLVDTDAMKAYPKYDEFQREIIRRTPAGRIGQPDDIARIVAFLARPESEWIIGQTIIADGGLSLI
jgi:enoyl-[acyl-carrier protein] reductase III